MRALVAATVCVVACGHSAGPAQPPARPDPQAVPVHEIDLATIRATDGLTRVARIVPFAEGGRSIGYKVYAPKDPALFARLGLHAGDLILKVNGLGLGGDAMKVLWVGVVLRQASRFDLDVRRKGETMFVRILLTGGTLGDVVDLRDDEPPADHATMKGVVDQAFDDLEVKQVAPNSFVHTRGFSDRLYDRLRPFVRMRGLLGRDLRDGLPLDVPTGSWLAAFSPATSSSRSAAAR